MSNYKRVNYTDIEPVSGAMHFLKEPLDSDRLGVTIARCEPNWQSQPHDHSENNHEEIYILIEGAATVVVDDETVDMESGDAICIAPGARRQIRNRDEESTFVLVSAPERGESDEDEYTWLLDGFQG